MKLLTNVLCPLLVFPFITFVALHVILGQSLVQSGLESKMTIMCEPSAVPHPYRLPYTNIPYANKVLCGMVAFFHALFDPAYSALLAALFPAVGVVALIPFLEASRDRRPFVLRTPAAIGALFQLFSMGVIMPVYALLFVITNTASIRPGPASKINQGNAEALLFGLVLGYVLPTVLMLSLVRPFVTATWQAFPLFVALAVFVHKLIRPPSRHVESGHTTVVVTLASTLLVSALLHVVYVWPVLADTAAMRTMFVPVLDVAGLDPAATSLTDGVLMFIKWDLILGIGSVMLATFWMADGLLCFVGILAWYGIAIVALGPAAATAGVFLWRERRLNGQKVSRKME